MFVKGYGYTAFGNEPVDVINAIRFKLEANCLASKTTKQTYMEFLQAAQKITQKMQDGKSEAGALGELEEDSTDPQALQYHGDPDGKIAGAKTLNFALKTGNSLSKMREFCIKNKGVLY